MSLDLHLMIHEAFQNFINIISDDPLALLPDGQQRGGPWAERLLMLRKMRKIIYGKSFGGGVVVRHLQMYGGLKINGAFSFNGRLAGPGNWEDHLLAVNFIGQLKSRLVVYQNLDDNRVEPESGLKFCGALCKEQREFVSLLLEPRGSSLNFDSGLKDQTLKGHHPSNDAEVFAKLIQAIIGFVREEKNESSEHMADFYDGYFAPESNFKTYLKIFMSKKFEDKVGTSWQYFKSSADLSRNNLAPQTLFFYSASPDFSWLGEEEKNLWRSVKELFFLERDQMQYYDEIKKSALAEILARRTARFKADVREKPYSEASRLGALRIQKNQVFQKLSLSPLSDNSYPEPQNEDWQKFVLELRRFIMAAQKAGILLETKEWLQALEATPISADTEVQPAI